MFKITEGDFRNQTYGDESYLSNWPMIYILENGKQQELKTAAKDIFNRSLFFVSIEPILCYAGYNIVSDGCERGANNGRGLDSEVKIKKYCVKKKKFL